MGLRALRPPDPYRRPGDRTAAFRGFPHPSANRSWPWRHTRSGTTAALSATIGESEMLYCVHMDVRIPYDLDSSQSNILRADEKTRAQELQRAGKWVHLW